MGAFHHPSSRFGIGMTGLVCGFLPAGFYMGLVIAPLDLLVRRLTSIGSIGAQALHRPLGSHEDDGIQGRRQQFDIMHVGPAGDKRERDATPVHEQAAFASIFFPDPWGWPPRIPVPAAL